MQARMLIYAVVLFIFVIFSNAPARRIDTDLPYPLPNEQIHPLRKQLDAHLQQRLEKELRKNPVWKKLLAKNKMAVGLVDISDPHHIRFARINGDHMMYAASLPKLAILLASSQALADGILEETPEVLHDMRIMISRSDNAAATRMIDRLGMDYIQSVLMNPAYELYDPKHGGGLWVGKRYAKSGKRYPDPLMGISHGASVTQVCRFYYLLAMGKLVSFRESDRMLEMLADPEINHKFVNTLHQLVPEGKLYRKSGTWRNWHADSVMVWGPVWRRYIVVGLVEDPNGETILRDLIPAIESVLQQPS